MTMLQGAIRIQDTKPDQQRESWHPVFLLFYRSDPGISILALGRNFFSFACVPVHLHTIPLAMRGKGGFMMRRGNLLLRP